ncbi:group III truncated hemoglobin [Campylobacter helveticus]|uniref:Group III truncated hemoglobin n=1 Tax=Campylobacter helveticus TaxID=28898 RepID=A0ABY3L1Q7_9BACT|nr:group III truncated hemoglobin [Campylobacter helveticus]MCR2039910.1 group III truncated hemoglobin [Campylobacter helveticus]MCR2066384.1 group III truncated hemoglobin [Campylobacter helveticus]TXK57469.1 group III truncated hemoglobin [Campylobacter helveticus]
MKFETISIESIHKLMDIFYAKVRVDKNGLGAVFNAKIGTNDEQWNSHKIKIASFWEGMLLGSGNFKGNPMKAHIDLPVFPRELFAVWLKLFKESLVCICSTSQQRHHLSKSRGYPQRFQYMLYESGVR